MAIEWNHSSNACAIAVNLVARHPIDILSDKQL